MELHGPCELGADLLDLVLHVVSEERDVLLVYDHLVHGEPVRGDLIVFLIEDLELGPNLRHALAHALLLLLGLCLGVVLLGLQLGFLDGVGIRVGDVAGEGDEAGVLGVGDLPVLGAHGRHLRHRLRHGDAYLLHVDVLLRQHPGRRLVDLLAMHLHDAQAPVRGADHEAILVVVRTHGLDRPRHRVGQGDGAVCHHVHEGDDPHPPVREAEKQKAVRRRDTDRCHLRAVRKPRPHGARGFRFRAARQRELAGAFHLADIERYLPQGPGVPAGAHEESAVHAGVDHMRHRAHHRLGLLVVIVVLLLGPLLLLLPALAGLRRVKRRRMRRGRVLRALGTLRGLALLALLALHLLVVFGLVVDVRDLGPDAPVL
mmetsp:Transcript_102533/g.295193  ORF Transcript_102533/g.295193 Transcript_102533/m.295193 type:complete len:372 (+) Transcript_102533:1089-2204(+)